MDIPNPQQRRARSLAKAAALFLIAATAGAAAAPADLTLFQFGRQTDLSQIKPTDAKVSLIKSGAGSALRVATGHGQPWPGIALPAPAGHWHLSPFAQIALHLRNAGTHPLAVYCRVDNPGADGTHHCVTGSVRLAPRQAGVLRVRLKRTSGSRLGGKLFGMRGYPVVRGGPGTVDPANITQILVFVSNPHADHVFEISDIRATGTYTPPTAWLSDATPFFPFVDTFGQYAHKDWPGKTHSLAELAEKRRQEDKELTARPGPRDWDRYGGWLTGPQRHATGFFRVKKIHGKWWLVDPDGHLFFSDGIDCVGAIGSTPIAERRNWFRDFPGKQPEFAGFFSRNYALKGHYAGRTVRCFSFAGANLRRKYGPQWRSLYRGVVQRRLRSWGLNTIGNWSDEAIRLMDKTPYTDAIGSGGTKMIQGSKGYWGKFPDVFDPSFAASLRRGMAAKKGKSAGDPWCIGYFTDNEMSWGDGLSLAIAALRSPPDQPAKQAFVADLKSKYGEIAKLNQRWGTDYPSWEALQQSRQAPDSRKAAPDLAAFYTRIADTYFRTARQIIKAVAPHQLYLGCRFAAVNPRAAAAAAKYCDVVSYNLYRRSVAHIRFPGAADAPVIIGEFHLGALDRGLFHPGLVPVANQAARAQAYRNYVLGAVRHPRIVGCHWFEYQDEPLTGRAYDGENYQIGFVDVADTPYRETIAASREAGYHLYDGR